MKTLLILRHAKSSWGEPDLPDHDRPLNERGKRDAPRIGQLLSQLDLVPDRILSSTARRARKTARRVADACTFQGTLELVADLYLASPIDCRRVIRELGVDSTRLLVVAHNPGLETLVSELAGNLETMPTAALAHVEFDVDEWFDVCDSTAGRLIEIFRPRELEH